MREPGNFLSHEMERIRCLERPSLVDSLTEHPGSCAGGFPLLLGDRRERVAEVLLWFVVPEYKPRVVWIEDAWVCDLLIFLWIEVEILSHFWWRNLQTCSCCECDRDREFDNWYTGCPRAGES